VLHTLQTRLIAIDSRRSNPRLPSHSLEKSPHLARAFDGPCRCLASACRSLLAPAGACSRNLARAAGACSPNVWDPAGACSRLPARSTAVVCTLASPCPRLPAQPCSRACRRLARASPARARHPGRSHAWVISVHPGANPSDSSFGKSRPRLEDPPQARQAGDHLFARGSQVAHDRGIGQPFLSSCPWPDDRSFVAGGGTACQQPKTTAPKNRHNLRRAPCHQRETTSHDDSMHSPFTIRRQKLCPTPHSATSMNAMQVIPLYHIPKLMHHVTNPPQHPTSRASPAIAPSQPPVPSREWLREPTSDCKGAAGVGS
jgi:hypothetical protein